FATMVQDTIYHVDSLSRFGWSDRGLAGPVMSRRSWLWLVVHYGETFDRGFANVEISQGRLKQRHLCRGAAKTDFHVRVTPPCPLPYTFAKSQWRHVSRIRGCHLLSLPSANRSAGIRSAGAWNIRPQR